MARLEICLLGTYQITRDSAPITAFDSNKVRGLLAYLAVESERLHTRDALAALLWPDSTQRAALASLRGALSNLRRVIGEREANPPYLLIDHETVQFNHRSDYHLDTADILQMDTAHKRSPYPCQQADIEHCMADIDRYRGPFLSGFSIPDSAPFEEWASLWRERLGRMVLEELSWLADHFEACGEYALALEYAQRQVALDPWLEEGHRQVMRIFALSGHRSEALTQYENCKRALADELGVEPSEETQRLFTAIRAGKLEYLHIGRALPAPGDPPYKGLCFFDECDADRFFGREVLVTQLLERVEQMTGSVEDGIPLLAVVGASGSGKSSLLRAGIVPALRKLGWEVRVITPTAHPLSVLESSYQSSTRSHRGLLIIDQFEELFSLCHEESERETFLERIFDQALPVILVLRADFYGHCAAYPRLRAAVSTRQEYIGGMDAAALRLAIEEPARRGGWELDPGLVDLLLDEVGASGGHPPEPGALPLLEHTLLETWHRRRGRVLTLEGYEESGGVRGAIAQTAERVYRHLSPEEQTLARKVFLRLTELGEGTQDTRRRAAFSELRTLAVSSQVIDGLLSVLAEARLVTLGEETAEVAHEALIREWPALQRWLAEDRDGLRLHRHLTDSAAAWERLGRDESELYRGTRLAQVLDWAGLNENAKELTLLESEFLFASRQREQREASEREEQHRHELEAALKLAEMERARAEEREQASQRLFQEERLAYARELAAHSKGRLATQPDLSLLLALEGVTVLKRTGMPIPWDVQQAIHDVALTSRLVWRQEVPTATYMAVFSPDGKRVYYEAYFDVNIEKVYALDVETGVEIFSTQSDGIGLEITPDGKYLATANGAQACLWDALNGQKILTIPLPWADDPYHGGINCISPDGRYLQVQADADTGCLVDLEPWLEAGSPSGVTLQLPLKRIEHCSWISPGVAFSPDGKTFTTAWEKDKTYILWDTETVTPLRTFVGHTDLPRINAFSLDGKRMATSSWDRSVRIWDVESARELMHLSGHISQVHSVTYSPDGKRLASASNDALVILWDADDGRRQLDLHAGGAAYKAAFRPDGRCLFTTTFSGVLTMWDIGPSGRGELRTAPVSHPILWMCGSQDGSLAVESHPDGSVALLDTANLHEVAHVVVSPKPCAAIRPALSYDNTHLAVDVDGMISVWDIQTGQILVNLPREECWNQKFTFPPAFSPDGTLLATGGYSGKITVWNLVTLQTELVLPVRPGSPPIFCQFSPDGTRLAMGCWRTIDSGGGEVWIWDLDEPVKPPRILNTDMSFTHYLSFSPDGRHLASCGSESVSRIWDVASGEIIVDLRGHAGSIIAIRYSPDGHYLITVSVDATVKVWEVESGAEVLSYYAPGDSRPFMACFTPDSRRVVIGGIDNQYRLLTFQDFDELLDIVRARVTRDWKPEERRRYLRQ